MAGFRRAKAEQAAVKLGIYGPPGSGKTFTSLLLAEGLAKISGKRVAYVDTEHGTDFYCQAVPAREVHPEAFDFDAIYTRSLMEVIGAVKGLSEKEYGVVVLDSITHLWEAARAAYTGKTVGPQESIPMQAWGKIKKPYKDLMAHLLSANMHVIICGRQGVEYATDEETKQLTAIGVKMKAEGETPYEPHILIRMEAVKPTKTNERATIIAYVEKDRTGVLSGRSFQNPNFKTICAPLMGLLGDKQARVASEDETAGIDSEAIAKEESDRVAVSAGLLRQMSARIDLAEGLDVLNAIGKEITPQLKAKMVPNDVASLREKFLERQVALKNVPHAPVPETPLADAPSPEEQADIARQLAGEGPADLGGEVAGGKKKPGAYSNG